MDSHAGHPGTFDPFTDGHRDVVEWSRRLFGRVTVLVAVNGDKQPAADRERRAAAARVLIPVEWDNTG